MQPLVAISTRLTPELHRKLKIYCADKGLKCQDVISVAIDLYIDKYEKLIKEHRK